MSDWTNDDRARFDEAKRIIKSGDTKALTAYLSGSSPKKLEELGGFGTCVTHHYCDCTGERIKELVAECDRLLSANDTLVERINDLTEGYALEDTCPRVQCRTTSQRLHRAIAVAREHCIEQGNRIEALQDERDGLRNGNRDLHEECQRLRRERDDAINQRKFLASNANMDYDEVLDRANQYERALERIANTNLNTRPDGTYNISREALIGWAKKALQGGKA